MLKFPRHSLWKLLHQYLKGSEGHVPQQKIYGLSTLSQVASGKTSWLDHLNLRLLVHKKLLSFIISTHISNPKRSGKSIALHHSMHIAWGFTAIRKGASLLFQWYTKPWKCPLPLPVSKHAEKTTPKCPTGGAPSSSKFIRVHTVCSIVWVCMSCLGPLEFEVISTQETIYFSPIHSSFPEFSSFFLFSVSCESDCYWIDRG